MSKDVLVKQAFAYDAFGRIVPMASTQERDSTTAPVRGERLAGIAGGALGALTGIAGKHRSLGSLANAMMFGAQQGRSAGQRLRRFASTEGERARAQRRQDIDRAYERLVASGQITPPRGPIGIRKPQLRSSKVQQINAPVVSPRPRSKPMIPFGGGPAIPGGARPRPFGAGLPPRVPVSHRIPSRADVVPVTHQLAAPPSEVAVEPLALPAPRPDVPIADFEIIDDDMERGVEEANPFSTSRTAVRRPVKPGASRADIVGPQVYVQHRSRTERPSDYMSRQVPVTQTEQDFEEIYAEQDAANQQAASDAALQANAAEVAAKVTPIQFQSMQPTIHGAGAENQADEQMGQQVIAQTGLDDDPDLAGTNPADGVTPASTQTVEEAGQEMAEVAVKKPFGFARQGGFRNLNLSGVAQDAEELNPLPIQSSIDRLPVVGIRKARTRRVLIV